MYSIKIVHENLAFPERLLGKIQILKRGGEDMLISILAVKYYL